MKEKLLEELLSIIESTKNFALEELPKVAEEILFYGAFEAGVKALGWAVLVLVLWASIHGIHRYVVRTGDADGYVAAIALGVISFFPCILVIEGLLVLGKVYFAPRLYLIEQISKMAGL